MAKSTKITISKKDYETLCTAIDALAYIAYEWAPDEGEFRKETIKEIKKHEKKLSKIREKYILST